MTKYRWYKDIWGWIGGILGAVVLMFYTMMILFSERIPFWIIPLQYFPFLFDTGKIGEQGILLILLIYNFIISFLLSLFIHKLFQKLKWVKK